MPKQGRTRNQVKNDAARRRLWGSLPHYLESTSFSLKEIREQQQALRSAFYSRRVA